MSNAYQRCKADFVKTLTALSHTRRASDVFLDWLTMAKIAFQNAVETDSAIHATREKQYAEVQARYNARDLQEFPKLLSYMAEGLTSRYGDFLGEVYMEGGFGNAEKGQFFTPFCVSRTMAAVNFSKEKTQQAISEKGYISLSEPSCGSGGTIVAWLEQMHLYGFNYQSQCFVSCIDLDPRCAYMCYITLSLLHVPAVVIFGNTLTREVFEELHTPSLCMQWLKFQGFARKR